MISRLNLRAVSPLLAALTLCGCPAEIVDPHTPGDTGEPLAETFYVSPSGDDANSGLAEDDAWRSIERVNRQALAPGAAVLFEGGQTFRGSLRIAAPVTVGSYGDGRARIDAQGNSAIVINNASGVTVERLELVGSWNAGAQSGNEGEGVSVIADRSGVSQRGVKLRELEIHGFKLAGIAVHARPSDDRKGSGYRDVEIDDCHVFDNGDVGVLSDGPYLYDRPGYSHANISVRRTRVHHNRGLKRKAEHTGSGIVLSDVDGATIEDCVAHHNGAFNDHPIGGGFGIWAWDARRVVIQHNEAYANETSTADGGGFDLDGGVTESVMRYNYSHDNRGAGYGAFQFNYARAFAINRIQYNISQNDGAAFLLWDGNGDMGSIEFTHNVGYAAKPVLATYSALRDATLANNIFYGTGPVLFDVFDAAGLELQGNVYWTNGEPLQIRWNTGSARAVTFDDFERYRSMTGTESRGAWFEDPQLVAAGTGPTLDDTSRLGELTMYQLRPSSPLIDRGIDLTQLGLDVPSRDFYGSESPRGSGPDVGPHEHR